MSAVHVLDTLVIGAGQAGLSAAHHLRRHRLDAAVVDAESGPGGAWRHRWPTLTMATVNGIRELPDLPVPPAPPSEPARRAVPAYFAEYERRFGIDVQRPVSIHRVTDDIADPRLLTAETATGHRYLARTLINATGTWTQPYWPVYPGALTFRGRQFHTHDYPGPAAFAGRRVVVIGGGISAVQLLQEIAPVVAASLWVTRRPPQWREYEFTEDIGRRAVAMVAERVSRGLPPRSVVSVTGLPLTPATRAAIEAGVLRAEPMFRAILPGGVDRPDGTVWAADDLLWCTGFRPALNHLAALRLREPGGGIRMVGTATARDPRVHLVGYGPSASTIGANRAGRAAVADIRRYLAGGD